MRLTIYADRFRIAASGIAGGEPGALGYCEVMRGGQTIRVRSKDDMMLQAGDVVTLATGGGGGYGDASARGAAASAQDAALAR